MQTPATPTSRFAARARSGCRRRALGRLLPAVTALGLALACASCGGGSSSPGVARVGSASGTSTGSSSGSGGGTPEGGETSAAAQQKMVEFAQCMRTHGEPEFPEPTEGHILVHNQNGRGPNPESSRFKAAEKACKRYAPARQAPSPAQRAKIEEQALKFSECMRHHGVPNFPDPEFSGGGGAVRLKVGRSSGIDPGSPQFQAAQKACQSTAPFGKGGPPAAKTGGPAGAVGQSSVAGAP
jgi:hypothetical protein